MSAGLQTTLEIWGKFNERREKAKLSKFPWREAGSSGFLSLNRHASSRELACRFNDRKPLDPASRHGNLDNLAFSRRSLNLPQISSVVCKPADNAADSLNSVQFSRETGARSILPFHLSRSFLPFHPKGTETETVCSKEGFLIRINVFSKSSFITLC